MVDFASHRGESLFIRGLFYAAASISDHVALMVGWLVNDELEMIWKEVAVATLTYCSGIFLEKLRKTPWEVVFQMRFERNTFHILV
jgi:hypothetical protein